MKFCLECGWGGHLTEMLNILDAFEGHEIFFQTDKDKTTEDLRKIAKVYYNNPTCIEKLRTIKFMSIGSKIFLLIQLFKAAILSIKILIKEKPDIIITTGGGATIPLCYIGKLCGVHIIYIESLARVYNPSGLGKLIYPIADLFLVQWEPLLKKYGKKAKYWGQVF